MARNQFPGTCYRCGEAVDAGKGHFEGWGRYPNGKKRWRLQHAECAIVYRGTDRTHTGPRPTPAEMHARGVRVEHPFTCLLCNKPGTSWDPAQKRHGKCKKKATAAAKGEPVGSPS